MKPILIAFICLLVAACTTTKPGPEILTPAQNAIQAAEAAGGDEFAPVEMRFAREKLASAQKGIEKQKYKVAVYLMEQAEINAELANEKSRTAKVRRLVNEQRKSNAELNANLRETFGDEFK
jgi:septal ring factor EnvC (AmiA/AmiB activator)